MNHSLADAHVARRYALVEAENPRLLVYPSDASADRHLCRGIVVELQPRLDEPDRIGGRRGGESGARGAHDVHDRRVGGELSAQKQELNYKCFSWRRIDGILTKTKSNWTHKNKLPILKKALLII